MMPIPVPGAPAEVTSLRTSVDWNEQALGRVYYDANNPAGVTIDGVPDTIEVSPSSLWTQIAGDADSVVSVSAIPAGLGGTPSTYYKDDSTVDPEDTGDQRSFGDAGLQVQVPTPGVYVTFGQIYIVTGTTANVGSVFAGYYVQPLETSVEPVSPTWHLYMPLVLNEWDQ
jgi:hypothetical protein